MAVFKIGNNNEIIVHKDAIKLVPELKGLTDNELKYVILVTDYIDSPLKAKPLSERKNLAKRIVYGNSSVRPETEKVRRAMEWYKSIIFDIRYETIDIYTEKIQRLQKETLNPDTPITRLKEIDQAITFLQNRIVSLQRSISIEEGAELELKGGKKLSFIEIWQRKQREYEKFKIKK